MKILLGKNEKLGCNTEGKKLVCINMWNEVLIVMGKKRYVIFATSYGN